MRNHGDGIGESNERGRLKIPLFNGLFESPLFNGKSTGLFFWGGDVLNSTTTLCLFNIAT